MNDDNFDPIKALTNYVVCSKCGARNSKGSNKCRKCGYTTFRPPKMRRGK